MAKKKRRASEPTSSRSQADAPARERVWTPPVPVRGWWRATRSYPTRWWQWTIYSPLRIGVAAVAAVGIVTGPAVLLGVKWPLWIPAVGAAAVLAIVALPRWFWAGRNIVRIASKHDDDIRRFLERSYRQGLPSKAAYRAVVDAYPDRPNL